MHTQRFSLVTGYSRSVSWCESRWDLGALSQDSLAGAGAWAKQGHLSQQLARSGLTDYFILRILFPYCSEQEHV